MTTTELATVEKACITKRGENELELTAENSMQMGICMDKLTEWCDYRIGEMQGQVDELEEELEIARKNKWKSSPFKRQLVLARKRVLYYRRIKAALEAGYCPIPNLPGVDVFAIRTNRGSPHHKTQIVRWTGHADVSQNAAQLPPGEGDYVSPDPFSSEEKIVKEKEDGKKETTFRVKATAWDGVEFPLQMAKPVMMEATSRAMAIKVFDEIGLLPAGNTNRGRPRGDPLILGHIIDPRPTGWSGTKKITFIIGWRLDTAAL